jgi:hypothetical protein
MAKAETISTAGRQKELLVTIIPRTQPKLRRFPN